MEVPSSRRLTLSIRWLLQAAQARSGKSFADKLSSELLDAASNQGAAIRKREEAHKMAEANRAFSHYRV
jgi:small subunit ribosomal protein S7